MSCHDCREWPEALSSAMSPWLLAPPADDLVHALKYEGWRELADFMGRSMAREARGLPAHVVVPVPTTRRRERTRGYNQARLLARVVAAELGLPLRDALARKGDAGSQTTRTPAERRRNVADAFTCAEARVDGLAVLLVDDVLTTGATAGEAAATLSRSGAASIHLLTFARALPDVVSGLS